MAYLRYKIECAIKLDENGNPPPAYNGIKVALEKQVRNLKSISEQINTGMANVEDTALATKHICHHDNPHNTIPCTDTMEDV